MRAGAGQHACAAAHAAGHAAGGARAARPVGQRQPGLAHERAAAAHGAARPRRRGRAAAVGRQHARRRAGGARGRRGGVPPRCAPWGPRLRPCAQTGRGRMRCGCCVALRARPRAGPCQCSLAQVTAHLGFCSALSRWWPRPTACNLTAGAIQRGLLPRSRRRGGRRRGGAAAGQGRRAGASRQGGRPRHRQQCRVRPHQRRGDAPSAAHASAVLRLRRCVRAACAFA